MIFRGIYEHKRHKNLKPNSKREGGEPRTIHKSQGYHTSKQEQKIPHQSQLHTRTPSRCPPFRKPPGKQTPRTPLAVLQQRENCMHWTRPKTVYKGKWYPTKSILWTQLHTEMGWARLPRRNSSSGFLSKHAMQGRSSLTPTYLSRQTKTPPSRTRPFLPLPLTPIQCKLYVPTDTAMKVPPGPPC